MAHQAVPTNSFPFISIGNVLLRHWKDLPTLQAEAAAIIAAPGAEQKCLAGCPLLTTIAPIAGELEAAISVVSAASGEQLAAAESAMFSEAQAIGWDPTKWAALVQMVLAIIKALTGA